MISASYFRNSAAAYYFIGLSGGNGSGYWKKLVYTGLSHSYLPEAITCSTKRLLERSTRLQALMNIAISIRGRNQGRVIFLGRKGVNERPCPRDGKLGK